MDDQQWPKWYVNKDTSYPWYLKRISDDQYEHHSLQGVETGQWDDSHAVFVGRGLWIEVTEDEAKQRLDV